MAIETGLGSLCRDLWSLEFLKHPVEGWDCWEEVLMPLLLYKEGGGWGRAGTWGLLEPRPKVALRQRGRG